MISVFPSDCTDFSGNGLVVLAPSSCTVTETLNGAWELTLEHPLDDAHKWYAISRGSIIRAPVPAAMTPRMNMADVRGGGAAMIYRITASTTYLRKGASSSAKKIKKYKRNAMAIVLNTVNASWYEVTMSDGKHGYMASSALAYDHTDSSMNAGIAAVVQQRQLRDQPFRIYRVEQEPDKVTAYARHIFYDLMDNMIRKYTPLAATSGADVVQGISSFCLSEHDFSFWSDLTSTVNDSEFSFANVNPIDALLGDDGFIERYGGELARDWFDVYIVDRAGRDSSVSIRHGKNLLSVNCDVDETDIVTRIMPTGETKDGKLLYLDELYVDSPNLSAYPAPKWIHLPVSDAKVSSSLSTSRAKQKMRQAAQAEFAKGCDLPSVTMTVDFVNLSDTEEYADYRPLTDIFIGDTVRVIVEKLGISVAMRMTQYTYDCLTRKYTDMTLGTLADTLEGSTISARQIAAGSITGAKLAIDSVGAGQIRDASIDSAHIQTAAIQSAHIEDAAITRAKIADALVTTLTAEALTAVSARIEELAAGHITTDDLYAALAMIASAQITAANIDSANIQWADIDSLAAEIATVAKAHIADADIQWASISGLSAAVASIAQAQIGIADIDFSRIVDLVAGTNIFETGSGGELYVHNLIVTDANIESVSANKLTAGRIDAAEIEVVNLNAQNITVGTINGQQIAQGTITGNNIAPGTITTELIAEGCITPEQLANGSVTSDKLALGAVTADRLNLTKHILQ